VAFVFKADDATEGFGSVDRVFWWVLVLKSQAERKETAVAPRRVAPRKREAGRLVMQRAARATGPHADDMDMEREGRVMVDNERLCWN
jgi:hypothetical protein